MLLKKVIWWLSSLFATDGFFDFAYLGDLSKYRLAELQAKLAGRWKQEVTLFTTYQLVKWSDKNSSYTIYYTLTGEFIQIREEYWKKENELWVRPLIKDFEFK